MEDASKRGVPPPPEDRAGHPAELIVDLSHRRSALSAHLELEITAAAQNVGALPHVHALETDEGSTMRFWKKDAVRRDDRTRMNVGMA